MLKPIFTKSTWFRSTKLSNSWASSSTNTISSPRKVKFTDATLLGSDSGSVEQIALPDRPAALMIKQETSYEVSSQDADVEGGEGVIGLKAGQLQADFSAAGGNLCPGYSATVTGPRGSPIPSASCSRTDLNSGWSSRRGC